MLGAFHDHGRRADEGNLLEEMGLEMSEGIVRQMLSRMVKDGQRKKLGRGAYCIPYLSGVP